MQKETKNYFLNLAKAVSGILIFYFFYIQEENIFQLIVSMLETITNPIRRLGINLNINWIYYGYSEPVSRILFEITGLTVLFLLIYYLIKHVPSKPITIDLNKLSEGSIRKIIKYTLVISISLFISFVIFSKPFQGLIKSQNPNLDIRLKNTKEIKTEEINNLGYRFYLGEIEDGPSVINDDLKNEITRIIYDSKFPQKFLDKTAIYFINSLSVKTDTYLSLPFPKNSTIKMPELGPEFLHIGGMVGTINNGYLILINKDILKKSSLREILTHEFGHIIGYSLTDQDWKKYYELRSIPASTPRYGGFWNSSPGEDFAEVYKNIFTGLGVRTYHGFISQIHDESPEFGLGYSMFEPTCMPIYYKIYSDIISKYQKTNEPQDCKGDLFCMINPNRVTVSQKQQAINEADGHGEVQSCRREVVSHPEKYPKDYQYGVPYKSIVGPKTKEFINNIIKGLN